MMSFLSNVELEWDLRETAGYLSANICHHRTLRSVVFKSSHNFPFFITESTKWVIIHMFGEGLGEWMQNNLNVQLKSNISDISIHFILLCMFPNGSKIKDSDVGSSQCILMREYCEFLVFEQLFRLQRDSMI